MNSTKPLYWAALGVGLCLALYFFFTHSQMFGNMSFLGGIVLIELIIASLWKYEQRFIVFLLIIFLWAGMSVPLQSAGTNGRWVVLAAGAAVGFVVWTKAQNRPFGSIHLIAFFCVCAAFVSATVSPFVQMASLKALSLCLLFLYCSAGARVAVAGREERFFSGLVFGAEIAVYGTAICYLALGDPIWGNPNSLGAAMSIAVFPILLWGWLSSAGTVSKTRKLFAVLLCAYLVRFSLARAGMISLICVTIVCCVCLRQYKMLVKAIALVLFAAAIGGMLAPETLNKQVSDLEDAVLYKGHKQEGVLGSRRTPWEKSIASIKERPWFGTGYGTSPTGEDPGLNFGTTSSSAESEREHGSSYITITEWVGLLGVLPFVALLYLTIANVWRVCVWMRRTGDPHNCAIPLAMVALAGLLHANFEDWLFAVGSYLCLFFWVCSFLLADLIPESSSVAAVALSPVTPRPYAAVFGVVAPNPVAPNPMPNAISNPISNPISNR
jgi:O-antigen ligase